MADITQLLAQIRGGDADARGLLFAQVYQELCRLARGKLARESDFTHLDTHSLVHESYLRLIGGGPLQAEDRRAFYAYAATVMRNIIVDEARRRAAAKRGGGQADVTLVTSIQAEAADEGVDVQALDAALRDLARHDERCHQIVELRYFGGLSIDEAADITGLSPATVKREWQKARAFLFRALKKT